MDFVHDRLASGSKLRLLTVIDVFAREALAIEVGPRLRGEHVAAVLNGLINLRGVPKAAFCDNGAEFTCRSLINGLTRTRSDWTSRSLEHQPTMLILNPSMEDCVMSF